MKKIKIDSMNKRYIVSSALLAMFFGVSVPAQNLNPTVSVSRAYEGSLMEVHKPSQVMSVPDSLLQFDLDFDYSVFEKPYKGAYDFKPYFLQMKPQSSDYNGNKFFLRAGAGYQLRPAFDAVWEPVRKGRFRMSVYGSHHSYIGNYNQIALDDKFNLKKTGDKWSGYDMYSNGGAFGQVDFSKAVLSFDADYLGIHTKDQARSVGYNSGNFNVRFRSENPAEKYFFYDVKMKYSYAQQGIETDNVVNGTVYMNECGVNDPLRISDMDFVATMGPVLDRYNSVLVDAGVGITWYGGYMKTNVGNVYVTPRYVFKKDRWDVSAGVRLNFNISDKKSGDALNKNHGALLYPDVHIAFSPIKNIMNVYFRAKGGDYRNPYFDLKQKNHFFMPYSGMSDNTATQFDVSLGLEGNVWSRLRYDLKLGFTSFEKMPFDMATAVVKDGNPVWTSRLNYLAGSSMYSELRLQWESRNVSVDSRFRFNDQDVKKKNRDNELYFKPSVFTGYIDATYNWRKRVFAGVSAECASRRKGRGAQYVFTSAESPVTMDVCDMWIPAWFNLGVHVEYAFTRKMSFWVRGENLLNADIQRTPFYTEGGIGFTAGICLNL